MTSMRKLLGLFSVAIVFGAVSSPAIADSGDQFRFVMAPATVSAGAQSITATITNRARFDWLKSFKITVPANVTIGTPTSPSISPSKISVNSGVISVSGLLVPYNQSVTLTIPATFPAAGCAANAFTWNAQAFGGLIVSNEVFALDAANSNLKTTLQGASCVLGFVKQPAGAEVGKTITSVGSDPTGAPVQVALLNGGMPDASFSGQISLAIKSGTGTAGAVLSGGAATAMSGVATFPSLSIDKVGTGYVLTASSGAYTPVNSTAFNIFAAGNLGCTGGATGNANYDSSNGKTDLTLDPNPDSAFVGSPGWGLRRGANTDGASCVNTDYTFTLDTVNKVATLLSDKTTGQSAAFKYVVLWNPVPVDQTGATTGWTQFRPQVSWGIANPVPNTMDYIPALSCVSDPPDLSVLTPAQLLALLPIIPNVAPFDTNPNSQFQPGATALMCIAQQGFTSVGLDGTGKILVQYWDKVIDESDGHIAGP